MKTNKFILVRNLVAAIVGTVCFVCSAGDVAAQQASSVTRVEEDWEMEVISASDDLTAPQIVMEMSPDNSQSGNYFTFEINHSTLPEFSNGGIQVHTWINDESHDFQNSPTSRTLERVRETIRWTQVLEVQDGSVDFSVRRFASTSIGHFQNDPLLTVSMPTSQGDLSSYSPQNSVDKTTVPYAQNRVRALWLKSVRFYSGSSELENRVVNIDVLGQ